MDPGGSTAATARAMWTIHAEREGMQAIHERFSRQGTAYRRSRQLFAAGYAITAVQYSVDDPPVPLAAYRFDGIRFVRLPRARPPER